MIKYIHTLAILVVLGTGAILGSTVIQTLAWTAAPNAPTDCDPTKNDDCSPPINVGGSIQTKVGGLRLGSEYTAQEKIDRGMMLFDVKGKAMSNYWFTKTLQVGNGNKTGEPGEGKVLMALNDKGEAYWASLSAPPPGSCTEDVWTPTWGACTGNGIQIPTYTKSTISHACPSIHDPAPTAISRDVSPPFTEDVWSCDPWPATCPSGVTQTRSCENNPKIIHSCTSIPHTPVTSRTCATTPALPATKSISCSLIENGRTWDYSDGGGVYSSGLGCKATCPPGYRIGYFEETNQRTSCTYYQAASNNGWLGDLVFGNSDASTYSIPYGATSPWGDHITYDTSQFATYWNNFSQYYWLHYAYYDVGADVATGLICAAPRSALGEYDSGTKIQGSAICVPK